VRRFGGEVGYSLAALGLKRPEEGVLSGVRLGFLVGLGVLLVSFLVTPLVAMALNSLGYPPENTAQQPLIQGVRDYTSENPAVAIPAAVFVIVVLGPLVEELVFRGALFGGLYRLGLLLARRVVGYEKRSKTARWAALVPAALFSSVIFALLHGSPVIIPSIFILAVALCALYQRTGSLLPSFLAHATFNSSTTLLIVLSAFGVLPG
jgi:membrane protease YdiL (CAAX protease family)